MNSIKLSSNFLSKLKKHISPILACQILSMAISMSLAEFIAYLYPVDQSFWIPLTTFCVGLYINTPLSALRRTVHRILGSIYGVIIAGIICLLFNNVTMHLIFLILFAGLTLWARAFSSLYYLFVTFMTASVIMFLAILMSHTALTPQYLITERLIFTFIGSFISLVVSIIVMPTLEKLDMLKTYRHYLSKFYLEYQRTLKNNCNSENNITLNLTTEIYKSSQTYAEKFPLWKYVLFFDKFIYHGLTRYLHRIHKMRIQNCIIANSITNKKLSSKNQELLLNNLQITKKIITHLIMLNRYKASLLLPKLQEINNNFIYSVQQNNERDLITISLTLKELEEDLQHLIHSSIQVYLTKQNELNKKLK